MQIERFAINVANVIGAKAAFEEYVNAFVAQLWSGVSMITDEPEALPASKHANRACSVPSQFIQ